jgi:hypothetical protein
VGEVAVDRRAEVAEVGVAAAPRWGSRRAGVGKPPRRGGGGGRQETILGPPRADPDGGRSPPPPGAPFVGWRDERGSGGADPAPSLRHRRVEDSGMRDGDGGAVGRRRDERWGRWDERGLGAAGLDW